MLNINEQDDSTNENDDALLLKGKILGHCTILMYLVFSTLSKKQRKSLSIGLKNLNKATLEEEVEFPKILLEEFLSTTTGFANLIDEDL